VEATTLWFVGVSTGSSLVHRAFPEWLADLGRRDVRLRGRDLPPDAPAADYRSLLAELAARGDTLGAVVTSHKLALVRAGSDLFASLDPVARAIGEVNAVRRWPDGLAGYARDPVSVGRVVDRIWPTGDRVVCLGAGGTAVALGWHLLTRAEPPARIIFADRSARAAQHLRHVLGATATAAGVTMDVVLGEGPWDRLLEESPQGTLVVNATGLGKDRPGSPVTVEVPFPPEAVVWELNYRGDLGLLRTAERAGVRSYDGWDLFCHGWAAALGPILDLPDEAGIGDRFALLAAPLRRP
jgi:shikimate 5-dehydrogenase